MSAENITPRQFDPLKEWREQANCLDVSPETFFPEGTSQEKQELTQTAKKVCIECVAKLACHEYARTTGITDGIWGGLSERQRRAIRRSKFKMTEARLVLMINKP